MSHKQEILSLKPGQDYHADKEGPDWWYAHNRIIMIDPANQPLEGADPDYRTPPYLIATGRSLQETMQFVEQELEIPVAVQQEEIDDINMWSANGISVNYFCPDAPGEIVAYAAQSLYAVGYDYDKLMQECILP